MDLHRVAMRAPKSCYYTRKGVRTSYHGPRYYKITVAAAPAQILDRRVRGANVEYYVTPKQGDGQWRPRSTLVSDGAGPAFGESGGLFGRQGVHAETSSRERLRVYDARKNAIERIALWKKNKYL